MQPTPLRVRTLAARITVTAFVALAGATLTSLPAVAAITVSDQEIGAFRNKTVSAAFISATGALNITLDNNSITDIGGQRETVILTSNATGDAVNIANSQNTALVTFGNASFPVLTMTITITGTNPNVAGLGGLVDMAPAVPAVAGFESLNEPVIVNGGAEADTIIAAPRQSLAVNGGGGNDTIILRSSAPGIPVFLNGDGGDDTFTLEAMPASGGIVNVDGGPHVNGDTLVARSAIAPIRDNGSTLSGPGIGTVFFSNIEFRSVFGQPTSVPALGPWALAVLALGVVAVALRRRGRAD